MHRHAYAAASSACVCVPMYTYVSLYRSIQAFSAGCGDGSFLFEVLCGVKTVCPLSSILFVLCVNPFVDLVIRRCDAPKLSVTRICADDFGSALQSLMVLKAQANFPCC